MDSPDQLIVDAAIAFARISHKGQMYGDFPYTYHLKKVSDTLLKFSVLDPQMHAAAWLHDVVEDTEVEIDEVEMIFGKRVADIVYKVTNESGRNRAERHKKTYHKIKSCNYALQLKLADRIANTEESIRTKSSLLQMYKKEYEGFRNVLYTSDVHEKMWAYLDLLMKYEVQNG